jgi:hypothetical protein
LLSSLQLVIIGDKIKKRFCRTVSKQIISLLSVPVFNMPGNEMGIIEIEEAGITVMR